MPQHQHSDRKVTALSTVLIAAMMTLGAALGMALNGGGPQPSNGETTHRFPPANTSTATNAESTNGPDSTRPAAPPMNAPLTGSGGQVPR